MREDKSLSTHPDLRDEFLARVVAGQTFAEVGGLWGTVNERVSVAARLGARGLAMIDISEPEHELWGLFRERLASRGVEDCECIAGDICEIAACEVRQYQVVHCSGVLYHHPDPIRILEALRKITLRYLVLTSAVLPERVSNVAGTFALPPGGAVFVPALPEPERRVLAEHWRAAGVAACWGISDEAAWDSRDLSPWWWLMPPRVMLAMAGSVRFRTVDAGPTWNGNAYTALLEAV